MELAGFSDTDDQTLSLTGTSLAIADGNAVDLSVIQDGFEADTDTDDDIVILESFSGLSLDPSSPNYITSRIGDMTIYFDFDKVDDEQRIAHPSDAR